MSFSGICIYIVYFHAQTGTFKGEKLLEYLGEWLLVDAQERHFYELQTSSSEGVFTCTSGSAIGIQGKLILQVTDSLLLRQNCGLQILNLLQQPLKQLRLDTRTGEKNREEGGKGEQRKKGKKDRDRKRKLKVKKKRGKIGQRQWTTRKNEPKQSRELWRKKLWAGTNRREK